MKIYIAPMAGVTDYSYRRILGEFKPDLLFTEMVSINAMQMANKKTMAEILRVHPGDGVQLFGRDIDFMVDSALKLEADGIQNIDVNFGCPMNKITKNNYGSALLSEPEHVHKLMTALKTALKDETKLSMKIRVGFKEHKNPLLFAQMAEEIGCSHITIHGRTKEQLYSGEADWSIIKSVKEEVGIPVIGNGDIFTPEAALERISFSGVDGVMLARGIQGNPWLITQIREILTDGVVKTQPTTNDKIDLALKHIDYVKEDNPDRDFVFSIRKHLCWYLKGVPRASQTKTKINQSTSYIEIKELLLALKN